MRRIELFLRAVFFFLPPEMIEEVARPKRWKKRFLKLFGDTVDHDACASRLTPVS